MRHEVAVVIRIAVLIIIIISHTAAAGRDRNTALKQHVELAPKWSALVRHKRKVELNPVLRCASRTDDCKFQEYTQFNRIHPQGMAGTPGSCWCEMK
jgi:hypothetical protein